MVYEQLRISRGIKKFSLTNLAMKKGSTYSVTILQRNAYSYKNTMYYQAEISCDLELTGMKYKQPEFKHPVESRDCQTGLFFNGITRLCEACHNKCIACRGPKESDCRKVTSNVKCTKGYWLNTVL